MHLAEIFYYSAEEADTIDINPNDKLKEVTYSFGTMRRGYVNERFKIISLRTGKEKVIYSNESFLFPGEDEFASGLTVGDSVYVLYNTELKDLDNDGIKEIAETKKIGLLLNKTQEMGDSYWDMMIEEETYLTIYSFKNGVFLKAKSELLSSKTDDYGILTGDEVIPEE